LAHADGLSLCKATGSIAEALVFAVLVRVGFGIFPLLNIGIFGCCPTLILK